TKECGQRRGRPRRRRGIVAAGAGGGASGGATGHDNHSQLCWEPLSTSMLCFTPPESALPAHARRLARNGASATMGGVSISFGPIALGVPVVLAPMAGVTNAPFRALCRRAAVAGLSHRDPRAVHARTTDAPAGLYVTEMVTSRALVERSPESLRMITHDPAELAVTESWHLRSYQLYGVDSASVHASVWQHVADVHDDNH